MNRGIKVLQTSALPLGYVAANVVVFVFIDHRALTRALQSHVGDPDQARTDDLQRDRLAF